jgi:hypothetical protein
MIIWTVAWAWFFLAWAWFFLAGVRELSMPHSPRWYAGQLWMLAARLDQGISLRG